MSSYALIIGKVSFDLSFTLSKNPFIDKIAMSEADDIKRERSGLAANIAYGVAILGGKPILTSMVGRDFNLYYKEHLESNNVVLRLIYDNDRESACVYHITIPESDTITIVQNNSYRFLAEKDIARNIKKNELKNLSVVFIGTGIVEADVKFVLDVDKLSNTIPLIYSPDFNSKKFVKWRLNQILQKVSILVCKENEINQFEKVLGLNKPQIIETFNRLKYIISVHDRSKIVIHSKDLMTKVSDAPVEKIVSEREWYDAFRAGLVYGVSMKKPIIETTKIASAIASYSMERKSFQTYEPSLEQVSLRAFEVKVISKNIG